MARDQRQRLYFNPRLEQGLLNYVSKFYRGDINEVFKNAFEHLVVGMYKSDIDKEKIRTVLNQASYIPQAETKRKGLEEEKPKVEKLKTKVKTEKEIEDLLKSSEILDSVKEALKGSELKFEIEGKEFPVSILEIGGKDKEKLKTELRESGFRISENAQAMIDSSEFTTLENPEEINLVKLKVSDLGFSDNATTDQIYDRAEELGLELCPAEVGPHQRLKEKEQPLGDYTESQ